jgi:cyclopropane fatty-acyl-phospholipid synthase-like methyltransferase
MNPNKAPWEKGDFTRIAASMRESGQALVSALGVKSGLKALDLGCGDGTTAVPAAKLGADTISRRVVAGSSRCSTPKPTSSSRAMTSVNEPNR